MRRLYRAAARDSLGAILREPIFADPASAVILDDLSHRWLTIGRRFDYEDYYRYDVTHDTHSRIMAMVGSGQLERRNWLNERTRGEHLQVRYNLPYRNEEDMQEVINGQTWWRGTFPSCQLSPKDYPHSLRGEFVDGKVKEGPWATMCLSCHTKYGVGLGTGRGQKYRIQGQDRWLKVEG